MDILTLTLSQRINDYAARLTNTKAQTEKGKVRAILHYVTYGRVRRTLNPPTLIVTATHWNRGKQAREDWLNANRAARQKKREAWLLKFVGKKRLPRYLDQNDRAFIEQIVTRARLEKRTQAFREIIGGTYLVYRKSNSSWAGGEHFENVHAVRHGQGECSGSSERVWSANGKWSGNDSTVTFRIEETVPDHMVVVGGLVTLAAECVGVREYRATWAEQSRGFDLKAVDGFIIRGHHVRGNDLNKARVSAATARRATLATRIADRQKRSTQRAHDRELNLNTVWVTMADSLAVGNCVPATTAQAQRIKELLGGNVGAVRADVLLKIRDDYYVRRAIARAIQRKGTQHVQKSIHG